MITILKKPYLCAFSKNSIDFTLSTDLQYETSAVFPSMVLKFQDKPITGTTYEIKFTNPETGNSERVNLVAVDGSIEANYKQKWQIPDTSFSGTLAEFRTIVFQKLCAFPIFNACYKIELPIIELPGATPRITITANEAISELVMTWASNQPSATIDKYISEANSIAYYQPGVRDGYGLKASLFFERNYQSGIFDLITTIDLALDSKSIAHVDVAKYLDSEIESSWSEYPVPFEQELGYKADNLRRYYLEFHEEFTGNLDLPSTKTETLFVHWGGASFDDAYNGDTVSNLLNAGQWLTWWPSGKRILANQSDWLAWMNGAEKRTISIKMEYKVDNDSGEIFIHENIVLQPFETFVFNCGFSAFFGDLDNAGIKNIQTSYSVWADNQGKDGIRVQFSYGGNDFDEIIPFLLFSNNKYRYQRYFNWIGYYIDIEFVDIDNRWQAILSLPSISSYYLKSINKNIPSFNDWEYLSGTTLINLTTSTYPIQISDKKTFYLEENCFAKQLIFFNSFGIPESFLVSGEFQQNLTTSQELATRTEYFALSNLLPQQYVFDTSAGISYQTETLMLTNEEANRLMPLLNSTITFLKEENRFIPIIINAGTNAIYKVNSFLQAIKLELFRANETDRISYFDVLPEIEPIFAGNGISIVSLKRNLLNITDFGTIVITQNNASIGIFTWNSTQKYYSGTAVNSEGLMTFTLTCQVDGKEVIVSKTINYQWQMKVIETFAIGGGSFQFNMQGLYASQPMRIDWGDGNVEDETLVNSLVAYTHTFATSGKKIVRIFKPSFFDVVSFYVYNAANYVDVSDMTYLSDLRFHSSMTSGYYLQGLQQLQNLKFDNTNLLALNVGFQKSIEKYTLNTTNISSENFEEFIKEIWKFRKAYTNGFDIQITDEVVISTVAISIINGTGIYAGDGLNTYGISIVNI